MKTKEEVTMEKKDKPRLAEVLGVEVGELFRVEGETETYFVNEDGLMGRRLDNA